MIYNYLMPRYMTEFRCVGPECEDTCCKSDWNIALDKKTAMAYLNCPKESIRNMAKKIIKISENSNNHKLLYGVIGPQEDGNVLCGFCSKEGLCEVHSKLGEKALSKTCYTYPRNINIINGQREISAQLSCIEVAKKVLLDENSLEFVEGKLSFNEEQLITHLKLDTRCIFKCEEHEKIFWDLRLLILRILSNRAYLVEDRLVYLGLLHRKIESAMQNQNYIQVQQVIDDYTNQLDKGEIIDFGKIEPDIELGLDTILKVTNNVLETSGKKFVGYKEIVEKVKKGVRGEEGITAVSYYQAKLEWLKVKDNYNIMLENYLVQQLFSTVYPFNIYEEGNDFDNLFVSYFILVFKFILIRFNLIGLNNYYKSNLEEKHVIEMIARFSKVVDHNKNYLKLMKEEFKRNNILTLPYLIMMIKN